MTYIKAGTINRDIDHIVELDFDLVEIEIMEVGGASM